MQNQRTHAVTYYYSRFFCRFQQIKRGEHLLTRINRLISFTAQTHINAQLIPFVSFSILMDNIPKREPLLSFRINNLPFNTPFYYITRTGSAIIIEKVITVNPILRQIILFQQSSEFLFFRNSQIQCLLINRGTTHSITAFKIRITGYAQFIISFSFDKTIDKMGSIKAEHTIIKHPVLSTCRILIAQCRMPEQSIYFCTGSTSHQTHLYIILLTSNRLTQGKE